jgi:hypothetical protein
MQSARTLVKILFASVVFLSAKHAQSQTSCPGFPSMIEKKVPNVSISTYINGYLEYTPPGYDPGGIQLYPLIIYFHGVGEVGPGTSTSLCSILSLNNAGTDNNPFDIPLPERIERGELPTVMSGGNSYNYIVLSPQYSGYNFPSAYPSAPDVEQMINYAVAHYKVDPNRIYLTGMSAGANMVMEYVGSSFSRANRVAAIAMASECSSVGNFPGGPSNIAQANLPVWEVHCINDDNGFCQDTISSNWINAINAQMPPPNPLAKKTTLPITGWPCNTGFTHNTWNTLYNPAFTDGGLNFYNWLIQFSNDASLPVNMKDYSASLENSKVVVEWTTTNESNTDRFILERSATGQQFDMVAQTSAAGYSVVLKNYTLIDDQPLAGISYYRLSLINKDNRQEYFAVKKINNPNSLAGKVNIPNPVRGTLNIYLNLDKQERVQIQLFDLNGRLLKEVKKDFYAGTSNQAIDVTGFSHGSYLIRVSSETIAINRTIIIN